VRWRRACLVCLEQRDAIERQLLRRKGIGGAFRRRKLMKSRAPHGGVRRDGHRGSSPVHEACLFTVEEAQVDAHRPVDGDGRLPLSRMVSRSAGE
jgi:hypothetical protein